MVDMTRRGFVSGAGTAAALAMAGWPVHVFADAADFYRGKTIHIITGGAPGAAYDFVARAMATHFSKHIPGNPAVVVENMPGAASLTMTNTLYNRSARDGTVLGMPLNGIVLEPSLKLLSRDGGNVSFDISKMNWIGTPAQQPQVLWVYHTAPQQSAADLKTMKTIVGATAPGGDNYTLPLISNALNGTKFEMITGYKAVNDIFLAAEQGEVQGNTANLSSLLGRPDWMRDKKLRILVQFGAERLPELKDVPTAAELAPDEASRQAWRAYAMKFKTTYPIAMPPDVPKDRVIAMRAAFDQLMKDPAFIADAEKIGIDVQPLGGVAIEKIIADIAAVPEPVMERLRKIINP